MTRSSCAVPMVFLCLLGALLLASPASASGPKADFYLQPHVSAGQTLSDVTYRVIAIHPEGMDDVVVQYPATGTYRFLPGDSSGAIQWTLSARMDGKMAFSNAAGSYRDHDTSLCFQGKCNFITDASEPFFNPTFWGNPQGKLAPGQSWTVNLGQAWELGPAGKQTVTVLSVDARSGMVMLKRSGAAVGGYEGAPPTFMLKKNGKSYKVNVQYGLSTWSGQAVFQHGVVVSDELLCVTPLVLTSPELGVIHATQRQYMSLLEHPDPIDG